MYRLATDSFKATFVLANRKRIDTLDSFHRVFTFASSGDTYYQDLGICLGIGLFWKVLSAMTVFAKARKASKVLPATPSKNQLVKIMQQEHFQLPKTLKGRVVSVARLKTSR